MKKNIVKVVLFLLPIILLLSFLEYKAGQMDNEYKLKAELFKSKMSGIEVLFMGASPTAKGINTDLIEAPAFNAASNMQTLYYDSKIVDKYLEDMPNLKVVVFNVFPPMMQLKLEDTTAETINYYLSHYYHIPLETYKQALDIRHFSMIMNMGYDHFLDRLFDSNLSKVNVINGYVCTETGYMKLEAEGEFTEEIENSRLPEMLEQYAYFSGGEEIFDLNQKYLSEIIAKLAEKGIRVVLITTPGTKEYQNYYDPLYRKTEDFMKSFENNKLVTCINYFRDERFTWEDFADSSHLNLKGGAKIAEIINQDIIKQIEK